MGGVRPRAAFVPAALLAAALSAPPRAEPLVVRPPSLQAGSTWIVLELDGLAVSQLAGSLESGTFWDLGPPAGPGPRHRGGGGGRPGGPPRGRPRARDRHGVPGTRDALPLPQHLGGGGRRSG